LAFLTLSWVFLTWSWKRCAAVLGKAQWLPASGAYLYINLLPGLEAAQGFMYDGRQR